MAKPPKSFAIEAVTGDGAVKIQNRREMLAWVAQIGDGIELVGKLQIAEETRSEQANGYYRGVVLKSAAEETGQLPDDIHDFWCAKFIPDERKHLEFFHKMTGEKIEADVDVRRSSKLNRAEFYDFVELCRQWLIEFLGVTTPDPDPAYWRKRQAKNSESV